MSAGSTEAAAAGLLATLAAGRAAVLQLGASHLPFSRLVALHAAFSDESARLAGINGLIDRRLDTLRGRLRHPAAAEVGASTGAGASQPAENADDDTTLRQAEVVAADAGRSPPSSRLQRALGKAEILRARPEVSPSPPRPERRAPMRPEAAAPPESAAPSVATPSVATPSVTASSAPAPASAPSAAPSAPVLAAAPAESTMAHDADEVEPTADLPEALDGPSAVPAPTPTDDDASDPPSLTRVAVGGRGKPPVVERRPSRTGAGPSASERELEEALAEESNDTPANDIAANDSPANRPAPPPPSAAEATASAPAAPSPAEDTQAEDMPASSVRPLPPAIQRPPAARAAPAVVGIRVAGEDLGESDESAEEPASGPAVIPLDPSAGGPVGVRVAGPALEDDPIGSGDDDESEMAALGVGISAPGGGIQIGGARKRAPSAPSNAPRLTDDEEAVPTTDAGTSPNIRPAGDDAKIAQLFDDAVAAAGKGDLQKSIQAFTDVVDMRHDRVDAYIGRGRCYLEQGDYSSAMSDFQRAEDLQPERPDAHVAMGDLYFARKEYRRAIEYYDQAVELDGSHAMARCRRGISHYYRKNYRQAFQDLQRAYSLDPDIPNIRKYVQMAVKKMERGD
jgi:hypothetical protein